VYKRERNWEKERRGLSRNGQSLGGGGVCLIGKGTSERSQKEGDRNIIGEGGAPTTSPGKKKRKNPHRIFLLQKKHGPVGRQTKTCLGAREAGRAE